MQTTFRVISTKKLSLNAYCLEGIRKRVCMCKNKHTCFQFVKIMNENRIGIPFYQQER